MWAAGAAIRARREALGQSLGALAKQIGVTKSFLSLVENGKRQLTEDQATALAGLLDLPAELLLLGCGRLPEDVRGAIRADAAGVTAAVRCQVEQKPVVYPSSPGRIPKSKAGRGRSSAAAEKSLPARLMVSKASTSYRAHSYHTKVPPEAITPFIEAFTKPGDVVLDPFCGSGMTGVAALMSARHSLLSDLSPAAVHIARNYTCPCDPIAFESAFQRVEAMVRPTMAWLYTPVGEPRRPVEYTTWSDVYACPRCSERFVYWDVMRSIEGSDRYSIACPNCGERSRKADLLWLEEIPVQTHTAIGGNRIESHAPTEAEQSLIAETDAAPIPHWIPTAPFGPDREMWRASHRAMGIDDVSGFYTRRNLHALAALRHAIVSCSEGREREALLFAFTACVNRASRRYQWNAKRPTNVMTGTLYISSLRYEWNVWSLFRRKAADALRYFKKFPATTVEAQVFQRSATDLSCLPEKAVDMVFMDPPFGSNIYYADSSLLWDAWLGTLTDQQAEIVVSGRRLRGSGGKDIAQYGTLMADAFTESARVLRRGGRGVLAFSNSDDEVWEAIQDALSDAGMGVSSVHLLDKGQPSIKGVKGMLGKEHVTRFDLMLCLQHRSRRTQSPSRSPLPPKFLDAAITESLTNGGGRTDEVYSTVLRDALAAGFSVTGITMPKIADRCALLGTRDTDGNWVPRVKPSPPVNNANFVSGYLSKPASLPQAAGTRTPDSPPADLAASGGRNTAYYLAHSYHTKVPPEAIVPFLEHFTRPGDVVLDPFCGSGMTGVAASLAGRRAILNDLSTAAAHLSWNHSRPCEPAELSDAFGEIDERLRGLFADIYRTTGPDGDEGLIHWTMWSTLHRCPKCQAEFKLWDTVDRETGRIGRTTTCPQCKTELDRRRFETIGNVPAWISYRSANGKRAEKEANPGDVEHALSFRREAIETWYPTTPLGPDREMYQRCALHLQNVLSVADLYTPRNLLALSLLWNEILSVRNERLKRALAFAFTNTAWHGTRMRRYNARGGQRPLTGTLYVPQLSSEANVLEVMRNKIKQLATYYNAFRPPSSEPPMVMLGSATELTAIADASIDYIFTDPPFGSNIFYADCNLIWESWLGRITDPESEAVVNRSLSTAEGGKTLDTYTALMTDAMKEMARVLKPYGWATVVFHNTDAAVWAAIHAAAHAAGFEFHEAASLDRKQQSHKGYKGRGGRENVAHFDVVMNLRKPAKVKRAAPRRPGKASTLPPSLDLDVLVRAAIDQPKVAARGIQGVHAEIMRRLVSSGSRSFVSFADVRLAWERVNSTSPRPRKRAS